METGPRLNIKTVFPRYGVPMLKIRRSRDRLIFNMGIPVPVRHSYVETDPRWFSKYKSYLWEWIYLIQWREKTAVKNLSSVMTIPRTEQVAKRFYTETKVPAFSFNTKMRYTSSNK